MFVIKNNIRYLLINYTSRFSLSFKKPFLLIPLTMKSKTSSITSADKGSFLTCLNVICCSIPNHGMTLFNINLFFKSDLFVTINQNTSLMFSL